MRSIRWKIILACGLVVLASVALLNRYAVDSFDRFTRKALEEEMISHATLIGEQYKAMVLGLGHGVAANQETDFDAILRMCGMRMNSRFQVITPEGRVRFDSEDGAPAGADARSLPEVARALTDRYGSRHELTADRQFMFYHIAVPVQHEGRLVAIVHISRHTGPIIRAINDMRRNQRLAMALALAAAVLISAVIAQPLTRRLRRLTQSAMRYARGDAPLDLRIGGSDEIADLARAVTHMAGEIEKRSRYNRDFVSTVAHELRTPITSIRGAAEVLEQGAADSPDTRRKFVTNIIVETRRMTRLVQELRELTRLDTEILNEPREPVDYVPALRAMVERFLTSLEGAHAPITVTAPDEPITVRMIPYRVEQVVTNLLDNAVRYTPPSGAIELAVTAGPGRCVTTAVKDTGCGIAPGNVARVFDRFFTTEPKDEAREYGSGLGLAIARSIVESHQGTIRVESEPGKGACFAFTLPLAG